VETPKGEFQSTQIDISFIYGRAVILPLLAIQEDLRLATTFLEQNCLLTVLSAKM